MDDFALIPLTQNAFAIVDIADYANLSRYKWFVTKTRNREYAGRYVAINGKKQRIFMHRELISAPNDMEVDHRDGNGLNNRRSNLRLCTRAQNMYNNRKRKLMSATSRYKGVKQHTQAGYWTASIQINRRQLYIGVFDGEEDAARAYDAYARHYFKEFAHLNFPDEPPLSIEEATRLCRKRQPMKGCQYFGVTKYRDGKRWLAAIYVNKKRIHLGVFETAEDAARAYDEAVMQLRPDAPLNFPDKE